MSSKVRSRFADLRITRGALIIAGLELGLSLVFLLADGDTRMRMASWVVASPWNVFEQGRVWTLATGVFFQDNFIALLLHMMVLWMFVPTLERFWGTARFYKFFAITSLAATVAGCAFGYLVHIEVPVIGLDPFIYASIVAFGIVYARQPVHFFGVLPLTGRQLMYGILGFLVLSLTLQQRWVHAVAYAAAILAAAMLTSQRLSPTLIWRRWRIARARARLKVMTGGKGHVPQKDEKKWLN